MTKRLQFRVRHGIINQIFLQMKYMEERKMKKLALLMAALLLLLCAVPAAQADTINQDGMTFTLTTDKMNYAATDHIVADVAVTNGAGAAVSNVQIRTLEPDGYTLVPGMTDAQSASSLANGDVLQLHTAYYRLRADVPQTGDAGVALWIGLAVVSCVALVALCLHSKRAGSAAMALVLCVAGAGLVTTAYAEQSVTLCETVSVDGVPTDVLAVVTWGGAPSGSGTAIGTVYENEAASGNELSGAAVTIYDAANAVMGTALTNVSGQYQINLPVGEYTFVFTAPGYQTVTMYHVEVTEGSSYVEDVIMFQPDGQREELFGRVIDAVTNEPVPGALVRLRTNWNSTSGAYYGGVSATTDSRGEFRVTVEEGYYTAEVTKDGYITGYENLVCFQQQTEPQTIVLVPVLDNDEFRVVLTWNASPRDLDSHLEGPLSSGGTFHVYYNAKRATDNGQVVALLDVDDTSSYGPETTTFTIRPNGTYTFYVHDYTNRGNALSTAMSNSGAKVEVYRGSEHVRTYNVPQSKQGIYWTVFRVADGVLQDVNSYGSQANSRSLDRMVHK